MKRLSLILIATIAFTSLQAQLPQAGADMPQRRKLAAELLQYLDVQGQIDATIRQIEMMQQAQYSEMNLTLEQGRIVSDFQRQYIELLRSELTWQNLKGAYIEIYAQTFTQQQLTELRNFFLTEAGQAFVKNMPGLTRQTERVGQLQMSRLKPQLEEMHMEMKRKLIALEEGQQLKLDQPEE